jgi:hypothetical protein
MRGRHSALVLAVLLVSATLRAQDQKAADAAFQDGVEAVEEQRWAQAVTSLQNAVKGAPGESPRKVGQRFGAYLGQNDCANALDAWARSEQAGVIAKVERYVRELRAGSKLCEDKGFLPNAKLDAAVAGVIKQVETARSAANDVARAEADLFTADRRNRLNQVSEEIKQAEARLASGRRSRVGAELAEAQAAAGRASTLAVALRAEITKAVTGKERAQKLAADLDRALAQGLELDKMIEGKRAFLTDALGGTRQRGSQALANARRVADAARGGGAEANASALEATITSVENVNGELKRIFDELVGLERERKILDNDLKIRQVRDRFRLADQAVAALDARMKANPSDPALIAERQAIAQRLRTARRQLEASATSGTVETIEEAGKLADRERTRLVEMTTGFGPLTLQERGVNTSLVEATRLFLNGDYAQVLKVLQPAEPFPADMLFLEHVHLLRAAASHAQYLKGGRTDAALTEAARKEIGALKSLNPAFQPDSRVFSPRFLEFFRTVPASATPAVEPAVAGAP